MAGDYAIQSLTKSYAIEISLQPQAKGNVISHAPSLHLRKKPQPLLTKGERKLFSVRPVFADVQSSVQTAEAVCSRTVRHWRFLLPVKAAFLRLYSSFGGCL